VIVAVLVLRSRAVERDVAPAQPAPKEVESGLRIRLAKTRSAIAGALGARFGSAGSDESWQSLEDALILADVGPKTSAEIIEAVRRRDPESAADVSIALREVLIDCFASQNRTLNIVGAPAVVVVVGVNGGGKTTTIGKIAHQLVAGGSTVILGAADTFRAAADSQLAAWGDRAGVEVVSGDTGADPASVAFAAVNRAKNEQVDVVIIDTAGRLHAHTNLMEELSKLARVAEREAGAIGEVLLVLDGSTGQNGIAQARAFLETVSVTGVVLTKLDGSARGGVAVAVERELGLPIKYIGVGEGIDDLIPFNPREFVEALIS
jgi:fused signal recognition particle receptor